MYYLALSNCHTFNYVIHACLEDQVSKIIHEILTCLNQKWCVWVCACVTAHPHDQA